MTLLCGLPLQFASYHFLMSHLSPKSVGLDSTICLWLGGAPPATIFFQSLSWLSQQQLAHQGYINHSALFGVSPRPLWAFPVGGFGSRGCEHSSAAQIPFSSLTHGHYSAGIYIPQRSTWSHPKCILEVEVLLRQGQGPHQSPWLLSLAAFGSGLRSCSTA